MAEDRAAEKGAAERPSALADGLRAVSVPDHGPRFWKGIASALADEPQLRLRPRAAMRPATEPPPVIDERSHYDDGDERRRRLRRRRWRGALLVVAVLAVLGIVGGLQVLSDDSTQARVEPAEAADDPGDADDEGGDGDDEATSAPEIDPTAPMTPDGVGPLQVGAFLRDLERTGLSVGVDEPTFRGTGGTCFDAMVDEAPDVVLRFRSPMPDEGISEPAEGVLSSLHIDAQRRGSFRATPEGIALGTEVDEVRAAYDEDGLDDLSHPFLPAGRLLSYVPEGATRGLSFTIDGDRVTGISAGAADLIVTPGDCP